MNQVNIFTDYKQKENHFTNGLVSILKLAELEDLNFNSKFFNSLPVTVILFICFLAKGVVS